MKPKNGAIALSEAACMMPVFLSITISSERAEICPEISELAATVVWILWRTRPKWTPIRRACQDENSGGVMYAWTKFRGGQRV